MATTQKCVCGEPAPQRCSRCHNKYFCSALCSAQNWSTHKSFCYPLPLGLIQEPMNVALREGLKLGTFAFYQHYHVMVQESLKEGNHLDSYHYAQYFLYDGAVKMLLLNPSGRTDVLPSTEYDFTEETAADRIRKAGMQYNLIDGLTSMAHAHKLLLAPDDIKAAVAFYWIGIGDWKFVAPTQEPPVFDEPLEATSSDGPIHICSSSSSSIPEGNGGNGESYENITHDKDALYDPPHFYSSIKPTGPTLHYRISAHVQESDWAVEQRDHPEIFESDVIADIPDVKEAPAHIESFASGTLPLTLFPNQRLSNPNFVNNRTPGNQGGRFVVSGGDSDRPTVHIVDDSEQQEPYQPSVTVSDPEIAARSYEPLEKCPVYDEMTSRINKETLAANRLILQHRLAAFKAHMDPIINHPFKNERELERNHAAIMSRLKQEGQVGHGTDSVFITLPAVPNDQNESLTEVFEEIDQLFSGSSQPDRVAEIQYEQDDADLVAQKETEDATLAIKADAETLKVNEEHRRTGTTNFFNSPEGREHYACTLQQFIHGFIDANSCFRSRADVIFDEVIKNFPAYFEDVTPEELFSIKLQFFDILNRQQPMAHGAQDSVFGPPTIDDEQFKAAIRELLEQRLNQIVAFYSHEHVAPTQTPYLGQQRGRQSKAVSGSTALRRTGLTGSIVSYLPGMEHLLQPNSDLWAGDKRSITERIAAIEAKDGGEPSSFSSSSLDEPLVPSAGQDAPLRLVLPPVRGLSGRPQVGTSSADDAPAPKDHIYSMFSRHRSLSADIESLHFFIDLVATKALLLTEEELKGARQTGHTLLAQLREVVSSPSDTASLDSLEQKLSQLVAGITLPLCEEQIATTASQDGGDTSSSSQDEVSEPPQVNMPNYGSFDLPSTDLVLKDV
ncbi:MAG: zinc finger MYND domain-containing protein [archaeon]|nr:zinc finger MYND domain-containing protein [archaeon]